MRKRFKGVKLLHGLVLCVFIMIMLVPIEACAAQYSVTGNMSNLSFSGVAQATQGQDYTATISNNGGCSMPRAITVTVGEVTLAEGSSTYTYSARDGQVFINGDVITGNIVISAAATAHEWSESDVVVAGPSCTSQGIQSKYCLVCGLSSGGSSVAPTGHKFVNYVSNKDATCSKDGTKTATCSNKGCLETSTITDKGSRLPHTSTGKRVGVRVATCTEEGYTGDLLCVCGAVIKKGEKTAITEHTGNVMGKRNPTCSAEGYTGDTVCRNCNKVMETGMVIDALEEHSYGDWNTVLEATELKIGRRERVCSMCGIKESELIPAHELSGIILPICIIVLIIGGCVGAGFAIFYAVKKISFAPKTMHTVVDDEVAVAAAEAIIVTNESGNDENF